MTWVKVCGLTSRGDVLCAAAAGADALGFNTIPASPRRVDERAIARLIDGVDVASFLLTADLGVEEVLSAAGSCGVTGIQPYGDGAAEVAEAAARAGYEVLLPVRPSPGVVAAPPSPGARFLFDTPGGVLGGSGEAFDWSLVAEEDHGFVLAGGLGPDNIGRAVRAVRPWGVDAASRLEAGPGVKDPVKVAAFIERAKTA
ncbi:MAG TPA: phosphoribosylanthranilate isomerase [Acidimicrobiia bacterium]|jgi:phosphoribosylanthranilate isomerase